MLSPIFPAGRQSAALDSEDAAASAAKAIFRMRSHYALGRHCKVQASITIWVIVAEERPAL